MLHVEHDKLSAREDAILATPGVKNSTNAPRTLSPARARSRIVFFAISRSPTVSSLCKTGPHPSGHTVCPHPCKREHRCISHLHNPPPLVLRRIPRAACISIPAFRERRPLVATRAELAVDEQEVQHADFGASYGSLLATKLALAHTTLARGWPRRADQQGRRADPHPGEGTRRPGRDRHVQAAGSSRRSVLRRPTRRSSR